MKNLTLKNSILLTSCSLIGSVTLIAVIYLGQNALHKASDKFETELKQLTYTSMQQLQDIETSSSKEMESVAEHLVTAPTFKTVSIINQKKRVIAHAGSVHTPPVAPQDFPNQGAKLIELGQLAVFIQSIQTPEDSESKTSPTEPQALAWLVIEADRSALIAQQSQIIQLGVAHLILALLIAIGLANYIYKRIMLLVNGVNDALSIISHGTIDVEFPSENYPEFKDVEAHLNLLADKLSHYRSDMRVEIEQTTEDLRETLETIEIRNVELDIARKEAINANNAKSDFLANMSHEIRTPLNGIIGFTKLLQRSPLNSGQRDYLNAIKKSSEILLTTINDILDFSKIEAGQLYLEQDDINLREVVEDVVTMLAPTAHQKNLELVNLFYNDVPTHVKGDSLRIKQVITNLANNAIKFTEEGEISIRVMLDDSLGMKTDNLKISISDTGVGLTRHEQLSIFKAFSQADASTARQFGGTGLGLSICKALIEEMKGEIKFESDYKRGSCFWFTLPLIPADAPTVSKLPNLEKSLQVFVFEPSPSAHLALSHILDSCAASFKFFDSVEQLSWEIESQTKTSSKHDMNAALICLDKDQVNKPEYVPMVKRIRELGWRVIIMTPTLDRYGSAAISEASAHLVKPATLTSFVHAFTDLASGEMSPSTTHSFNSYKRLSSPHTILATDDNDINLALIRELVEHIGLSVELASSGHEAIERCRRKHYPLILMDIQMPEMDGVKCMKEIRNLDSYITHGNIIALTAYALPKEKEEFISQGFQNLITKPIDEDSLIKTLLRFLPDCEELSYEQINAEKFALAAPKQEQQSFDQLIENEEQFPHEEPVFDWNESVYLCNGNASLAKEISDKLLALLPENKQQIQDLFDQEDLEGLESAVHKLHGSCHYCGVPRLRKAAQEFEHTLKTKAEHPADAANAAPLKWLAKLTQHLINEIDQVLDWQAQRISKVETSSSPQNET